MKKALLITVVALVVVAGAGWYVSNHLFDPNDTTTTPGVSVNDTTTTDETATTSDDKVPADPVQTIATNLDVPWGLAFLPDGDILVTERPGELTRLTADGQIVTTIEVEGITPTGEAGLLGIALHPDFRVNRWLYLYETYEAGAGTSNRVVRYKFINNELTNPDIIIDSIPGAPYHDGGRIKFGPGGRLFITTGDATEPRLAQNKNSLAGKILRLQDDGVIPTDNPFGNAVLSLGHRNPQGITWDADGDLWSTEHGRSGIRSGLDEINLITRGGNYGWEWLEGDETCGQDAVYSPAIPARIDTTPCPFTPPIAHSTPETTWAPASAQYVQFDDGSSSIFFGGLRGVAVYEAKLNNKVNELETDVVDVVAHFQGEFGRIRTVTLGPNGDWLYLTTSNTDGRGTPQPNDDKIIRAHLSVFE